MSETLFTERLRLEPWRHFHDDMLVVMSANPAVTRYIGDGRPWTESRAREVSASIGRHWARHGFGWRAVYVGPESARGPSPAPDEQSPVPDETLPAPDETLPAPGQAIGLIALSLAGEGAGVDPNEHEIGWWLHPSMWGRGLAREGARAVRDDAFVNVGVPDILARIQPANSASLAVAAALGLHFERSSRGRGGEPISVLRLTADCWRAADPPAQRLTHRRRG